MKKLNFLFLACILLLGTSQMLNAQLYGKWVLSTTPYVGSLNHKAQLLEFSESGVTSTTLSTTAIDLGTANCELVNGAYNENYDYQYHFLSNHLIKGTYSTLWPQVTPSSAEFFSESEVFPSIGESENHCIVYGQYGTTNTNGHISLREITLDINGDPIAIGGHTLVGEINNSYMASFAITEEVDEERKLYLASCDGGIYGNVLNPKPYGLSEWTITETGITYDGELQEANSEIANQDFSAYNLEMKINPNTNNEVIAWITNNSGSTDKIFIYEGSTTVHDLNMGRIGGIEFSPIDQDIIYVSCANGIVKYDYEADPPVSTVLTSSYQHTFLQLAPDGNIYAVADGGCSLGRINMPSEQIENNVVSFPNDDPISNFKYFDGVKYYFLPENHRVFNYMTLSAEKTDVCPGACNGSCTITVEGGFPEYTYQLFKEIEGVWTVLGNAQTPEEPEYIFTDLCEGEYKCEVTDSENNMEEKFFEIVIVVDMFDVPGKDMELIEEYNSSYWNEVNRTYQSGFRIKAGVDVVITNSYLQFGRYGRVVIEPGASLTLINSTLNYYVDCDEKWRGVEVAGIDTQGQLDVYGDCQQGRLYMLGTGNNKSRIANAENGVSLYACTYSEENERNIIWGTAGGVVHAVNSEFVNNTKAVHFIPYQNVHPFSGKKIKNISSFELCSFDINSSYIDHSTFNKHIDLYGVNGIAFKGCSFTNTASNGISPWNIAIAAYGAGFEVESICSSGIDPCPEGSWTNSSFDGFYRAIAAYENPLYIYTFDIREAEFLNNAIGIFCSGVDLSTIIDCEFYVGQASAGGLCDNTEAIGIDMQESIGFAIENNDFEKYSLAAPSGEFAGIRVLSCPSQHDIIYKNSFDGLTYGNFAEGQNRPDVNDDQKGVEYQCNLNDNNEIDFIVTHPIEPDRAMIRTDHGTDQDASGNTFSPYANWHIRNEGRQVINWFYCDPCPDEEPVYVYTLEPGYFHAFISTAFGCPDHYGGGEIPIDLTSLLRQQKESDYLQNLNDYNSVSALYEGLKDGGDTDAKLTDIALAQPDDMWQLRAELLGDSPHLSNEVLKEMADRTDVFPDDILLEILSANPDELSKDTLLQYLEQKENPLPAYMINILEQAASGITYKTILEREMAEYHAGRTQAAQDIIRSILNDSVLDANDYRNWLDNLGGIEADKQIIASYLNENDTASASALMNLLPSLYNLEDEELDNFNAYKSIVQMQLDLKLAGKSIFELDSTDVSALEVFADNKGNTAGSLARNLLSYAYNYNFCDCLQINDTAVNKSSYSFNEPLNEAFGPEISSEPNPASTWTAFNYRLSSDESHGLIKISDVSGKEIKLFNIRGKQGQQIWDTRFVKSGVYFYTLSANGFSKTGKIIVN
jgi:hypothetical protein